MIELVVIDEQTRQIRATNVFKTLHTLKSNVNQFKRSDSHYKSQNFETPATCELIILIW